jgi:hypothetical protein
VQEAIALLLADADELATAMRRIRGWSTRSSAASWSPSTGSPPKALLLGKHKWHGVNAQVIADVAGRLIWATPLCPARSVASAARTHRIIDALTNAEVMIFAERGLSRCPRQRADAVQAAPFPAETVTRQSP